MNSGLEKKLSMDELMEKNRPAHTPQSTPSNVVVQCPMPEALGRLEIGEWEQWFDVNGLKEMMLRYCTEVTVQPQIPYEGKQADGLFCAWIGRVR